jgi:large subunit ribosomal protein L31
VRPDIHPDYHPVVFQDANTGTTFLTRSTATSARSIEWETPTGIETYPLIVVEISADSHPMWTGKQRIVDTAGQVEKFHRRYGRSAQPGRTVR